MRAATLAANRKEFVLNFVAAIGQLFLLFCAEVGRLALFMKDALMVGLTPRYYWGQIAIQFFRIGYTSLPVVAMTAFFTGGALALQIYTGSSAVTAGQLVPSIVAIGITRELGPVLAGLMVAGRVGASIAAELGTMKVTEQTDALVTLSTNPIKYLVGPRLLAAAARLVNVSISARHGKGSSFSAKRLGIGETGCARLRQRRW